MTAADSHASRARYFEDVLSGRKTGIAPQTMRALLSPLSWLYTAGLEAYLLPYRTGLRKQTRLGVPVVSVGNLVSGGTGKTPMAMRVCEELQALGATVCLLSRGYGGSEERGEAVVSDGRKILMGPGDAGDEPYLLAQSLPGVPVLVGKDRRATGRLAMERFEPMAIVLDDGMQFYQLHRDLDIVMLDAVRPFDNGWCLPRGLLREPPGHLRRASLVVISNSQLAGPEQVASLRKRIARLAPAATIVTGDYEPRELRPLGGGDAAAVDWLKGRRVASLCGIGNPEAFESSLARLGAKVVSSTRLRDHAKARLVDLETATGSARATGAEAIVVTEKDAVKLPSVSHPLPFLALVSRLAVSDEAVLRSMLIGLVRRDQP